MSDWGFIGAAYGLTWTVLGGYSLYLLRRLSRARRTYARIRQNEGELT